MRKLIVSNIMSLDGYDVRHPTPSITMGFKTHPSVYSQR